jgi:ketosteroid isomerase-like protein
MSIHTDVINPDIAGLPPAEDPRPILQTFIAAWNRRDSEALLRCFSPDATLRVVPPPPPPEPETYTGRDAIAGWLNAQLAEATPARLGDVRMLGNVVTWDTIVERDGEQLTTVSEALIEGGQIHDYTP